MGWCVRDGCQIDFWFDDWLSGTGVLAPKYLLDGVSAPCPVVSFVAPDGQWNIEALMQVEAAASRDLELYSPVWLGFGNVRQPTGLN
ncbi:hypothetical protein V6N11_032310 [Hibiscus sabdariffa]|uniref:Uncharacterized protein n=1 Tax=Hibiscus sabdariffa TaxID=183260 RepID=A0ABR2T0W6_9ROSI